jgi:hypothetical protein
MNSIDLSNRLEFNDDPIFNNHIHAITAVQPNPLILNG